MVAHPVDWSPYQPHYLNLQYYNSGVLASLFPHHQVPVFEAERLNTKTAALLIFESRCCYRNLNSFLGVSTNTVVLLFAFFIRPNPLPA